MSIQNDIEGKLAERAPDVEVLLARVVGDETVEVYIDHPEGVDFALCERVTKALPEVNERFALTVSSPGADRPLTKPPHFQQFIGRRARVELRAARDGQRRYSGELVGADAREVTLAVDGSVVALPYADILKSNLIAE